MKTQGATYIDIYTYIHILDACRYRLYRCMHINIYFHSTNDHMYIAIVAKCACI